MKTLDNIMHAKLIVRGETLRGIFDKSEIFSCFQMKFFFKKFKYVPKYMRKIFDQCFIFCFIENWEKVPFFEDSG